MDNKSLYDKILEASNIIARKARNSDIERGLDSQYTFDDEVDVN